MRYLTVYLIIVLHIFESKGQSISISNDGTPAHASSMLEVRSTTKGLLMPRMSQLERNMIGSPATGLMIYQTDNSPGFYFFNGSSWSSISTAPVSSWLMTGNSGSNPATDFIGTIDNQPLRFKVNNTWAGELNPASGNAVFGISSGFGNTSGTYNSALGLDALKANSTGSNNVATGAWALQSNTTGAENTAVGSKALFSNTIGSSNTAVGFEALSTSTVTGNNSAVGYRALKNNSSGFSNTATGVQALLENNSGNSNTATGESALQTNTSGSLNTATGAVALFSNTTGHYNTSIGAKALFSNSSGDGNTAVGFEALLANTTNFNSALGYQALKNNSSGFSNTAIGNNTLTTNITGTKNTALGNNADVSSDNLTNATAIGYNAKVGASNSLVLGGTGTDAVNVGIGTTNPNAKLEVVGTLKVVDGTQGAGKILTSNAAGLASWQPPPPPPSPPTYYPSVTICCQSWMTKNLNVATYRNGDPIPKVTDAAAWEALTTGAYCYYNNDSTTYAATYGKLYNWYAVNDSRGLAPEGWHIPTDFEWNTLGSCLGGDPVAGGPMKEIGTTHWTTPNNGATNSSGFTALPGSFRDIDGSFGSIGNGAYFWNSTELNTSLAGTRALYFFNYVLSGGNSDKRYGLSIRCLRD